MELDIEPREKDFRTQIQVIFSKSKDLSIFNQEEFEAANKLTLQIRKMIDQVKDYFRPEKEKSYDLWKSLVQKEKDVLLPLQEAEEITDNRIKEYVLEQNRIAEKRQTEADQEAQKAEEAAKAKLEKEAQKLESKGKTEEAQEKRMEAERVFQPRPVVQSGFKTTQGLGTSKKWTFAIYDESLIPVEFLMPDEKKIRGYVNTMKENAKIPGVRIFEDVTLRKTKR